MKKMPGMVISNPDHLQLELRGSLLSGFGSREVRNIKSVTAE